MTGYVLMMEGMDAYQRDAQGTAVYQLNLTGQTDRLTYAILGLVGEAGELANKIKKVHRGDTELNDGMKALLADELGDVLWYVAMTARELGLDLGDVASINLQKLAKRKENNTLQGSGDKR